jgi:hypothetical protein
MYVMAHDMIRPSGLNVLCTPFTSRHQGQGFLMELVRRVLSEYIDSDSIPMQNISQYFDAVEYASQGSVFWPDIYKDHCT